MYFVKTTSVPIQKFIQWKVLVYVYSLFFRLDGQTENGSDISQPSEIPGHGGSQAKTKLDSTGNITTNDDGCNFGWWHQ